MIERCRPMWLAVVTTVAACAAQPRPARPIGGTAVAVGLSKPAPSTAQVPIASVPRVHFAADAVGLSAAESAVVDTVAQQLESDPSLDLQVSGHTDPSEHDADNTGTTGLSDARAQVVRSYLIAQGIAGHRLVIRAVGATEPRDRGATMVARAANRRVEFERVTIKVDPFGGRTVVTSTDIAILDQVSFEPDKDVILPASYPILDAIAATLVGNPSILLVEVQSHTDDRGDARINQRLSDARALAVVTYLIARGVDAARLVAQGYGGTQPLDASHNEAAWAKNRRIAFLILKRSP